MIKEVKSNFYFDMAYKLALTSEYGKFRLGALIVKKNRIVSMGTNAKRSHPLQKKFSSRPDLEAWRHAEVHSLSLCRIEDAIDAKIYVGRVLANNEWASSKPCEGCTKALKHFGIKGAYYYDEGFKYLRL